MKTQGIEPNKLGALLKQVVKFNKNQEVDKVLPSSIDPKEATLIHAVMIESRANRGLMEYVHKACVKKFDQKSWKKHSVNFARIGKRNTFILHDGELWEAEQKKAEAQAHAYRMEELKKQAEREYIEEVKAKMKLQAQAAKEMKEEEEEELSYLEMRAKAKELGMELTNTTKKAEIIEFLKEKEAI